MIGLLFPAIGLLSMVGLAVMGRSVAYLAVAGGVALLSVGAGLGAQRAAARRGRARHEAVRQRYREHLARLEAEAASAAALQRAGLNGIFPHPESLSDFLTPESGLWERRPGDSDFGTVRLGLGVVPALRPVRPAVDQSPESDPDPGLSELADSLVARTAGLPAAPVVIPLTGFRRVAVVGPAEQTRALVRGWVAALAVFHAPGDLHVDAGPSGADWAWVAQLPHARPVAEEAVRGHRVQVDDGGPRTGSAATVISLIGPATGIPEDCEAVVEVHSDGTATYLESGPGGRLETGVRADGLSLTSARALAQGLAPRRLHQAERAPVAVRLSSLLGGARPLDCGDLEAGSHPRLLQAVIGTEANGHRLTFSLAEAAAGGSGPHGILVGATGSGKSELLRTVTLSLAKVHSPGLLNLVLMDFKGGAAFSGLAELPHVAGLVTNLAEDGGRIERARDALRAEVERRQEVLRAAGAESIRDLHDRAAGSLPYLVVVVDEFGELLASCPEFIDTFTTIASVGRSLGIHLLLATQRLDEGRIRRLEPHLRYRIALRTNTAQESRSVLDSPAAFELPSTPGGGWFRVDDRSVRFRAAVVGPELPALVQSAAAGADRARPVWLDPLPESLVLEDLLGIGPGRRPAPAPKLGEIPLGLVDVPRRQSQVPLIYDWRGAGGNLAIAGAPRSGKSHLLQTLAVALTAGRLVDQVHIYGLDPGAGGLTALAELPHVGAVVGSGDPAGASRLLRHLEGVIEARAGRHPSASDGGEPEVFLLVDDVGQLRQTMPELEVRMTAIANGGLRHGVHVVITANRWMDVRPQLLDAFGTRLELRLGDASDSMVGRRRALELPADVPGRGLTREGHVFQAARTEGLAEFIRRAKAAAGQVRAPALSHLPPVVPAPASPAPGSAFGLGRSEFRAEPVELDLTAPGAHLLVYGDSGSGRSGVLARVVGHLSRVERPGEDQRPLIHLVDPTRGLAGLARAVRPESYAVSAAAAGRLAVELAATLILRLPADELDEPGSVRAGPEHFLIIDDYERLLQNGSGPFGPLVDLIGWSADIGFHVVLARRVGGAARSAFEPFTQRLREAEPIGLVLSGSADEGPLLSGITAGRWSPGRGTLVRPGAAPVVLQCYLPAGATGAAGVTGVAGAAGQPGQPEERRLRLVGAE
ncbi:MAG: type VII secretion protein EccCb [Acidimicrobiales bacterium]